MRPAFVQILQGRARPADQVLPGRDPRGLRRHQRARRWEPGRRARLAAKNWARCGSSAGVPRSRSTTGHVCKRSGSDRSKSRGEVRDMQIVNVEVVPVELKLRMPYRAAAHPTEMDRVDCVFVRIDTREGRSGLGLRRLRPGPHRRDAGAGLARLPRLRRPRPRPQPAEHRVRPGRAGAPDRGHALGPLRLRHRLLRSAGPGGRAAPAPAAGRLPPPHPDVDHAGHRCRSRRRSKWPATAPGRDSASSSSRAASIPRRMCAGCRPCTTPCPT